MKNITIFLLFSLLIMTCGVKAPEEPKEKILVNIAGQATISVNEFLRRAEYVPRPDYCKRNTYLHKKIILNSLIAEKMLALEAGNESPLLSNIEFQHFIKGHKEQAMRRYMHHNEATARVALDTTEIKTAYKFAGREYQIAYFTLDDSSIANKAQKELATDPEKFKDIYCHVSGDTSLPKRKIKWNSNEHTKLHQTLFSHNLKKNQVLQPVKIDKNKYVFIKIIGWTDDMVITEKQQQERLDNVTGKLTQIKAEAIWEKRVSQIMSGKRMDFNEDVFYILSELLYETYFPSDEKKVDNAINQLWRKEDEQAPKTIQNINDEALLQESFFKVGGKVWTVKDFRTALMSHPLVFRNQRMSSKEFPQQFRLAVADLVRDFYVTQEAYDAGYDQVNVVERHTEMWRDTFLALNKKHQYLESVGDTRPFAKNYHEILKETLNPYIDELQKKYYRKIELDFEAFEDITLTTIDLLVHYEQQPFRDVVPLFPVITDDHLIEYVGKKENKTH